MTQNQTLSFGTIMKIFTNSSLSETQRIIEKEENSRMQSAQQQAQEEAKLNQEKLKLDAQNLDAERQLKDLMNVRDNETKMLIAQMNKSNEDDGVKEYNSEKNKRELEEKIRQFNEKIQLDKKIHEDKMRINKEVLQIKKSSINKRQ